MKQKIPIAILGATGYVGQRLVELLIDHPNFFISSLAASERSVGKRFSDAVNWLMSTPLPASIGDLIVQPCQPGISGKLVFSALDAAIAGSIEEAFASSGYLVVSNASTHRLKGNVPLLVPEVNMDHLALLKKQSFEGGGIITNPNCCVIGLTLALKPLNDLFGIEALHVVTMQAVSGAGYPGVASLDILDNVIPHIRGEEEKLEKEPKKILGTYDGDQLVASSMTISAQCNRVPVTEGHMECVSVKFKTKASHQEIIRAWQEFKGKPQQWKLPTAPLQPIHYYDELLYPQPKLHRNIDKGMAIAVGQLRPCPLFDYKFSLLSHNSIRGGAGGALLCAESLLYIFTIWRF